MDDRTDGRGDADDGDIVLADDDGDVVVADEPFDPMSIRDPLPQPLFSVRRLAMVALLVLAGGVLFYGCREGQTRSSSGGDGAVIVQYQPLPGGQVPRQSPVGVVLEDGWDGRLTIDGVSIPEEQMVGAIDPSSPEFNPDEGPRPNTKSTVQYQPGPGKAVTEYDTGTVEITVTYWRIDDPDATRDSSTYSVRVF